MNFLKSLLNENITFMRNLCFDFFEINCTINIITLHCDTWPNSGNSSLSPGLHTMDPIVEKQKTKIKTEAVIFNLVLYNKGSIVRNPREKGRFSRFSPRVTFNFRLTQSILQSNNGTPVFN
ncbi:hypothetical protein BpHYR1_006721 [Brachionus plicatilis]|uniref:Uncharacterized protein n=1 Tax=Brachionus plicatilis TaxID=10195 RepID=A0A3M7RRW9_BRAPC|nr:hypothetical protein BpHYR1_006721 [Brachionus plicatilis]